MGGAQSVFNIIEMVTQVNKVFVVLIKLFFLVWSGALLGYALRNRGQFVVNDQIVSVIVVLLCIAIVLTIVDFFRTREKQLQSSLVIISIFVATYLFEAIHLAAFYYPGFPEYSPPITIDRTAQREAEAARVFLDKRSAFEVVRDFRGRGIDAVPAFNVADREAWEQDALEGSKLWPLGGMSEKFIVHCNESGYWATYHSDEKGFNNPRGSWNYSSAESVDLLLLGDSFVHGACVNEGEDYGGQLRKHGYRVVNLGQRGNGPLLQLAGLREYGYLLRPRVVLWFYLENNDLINLRAEAANQFLRKYLREGFSQDLPVKTKELDRIIETEVNTHWGKIQSLSEVRFTHLFKYWITLRMLRKRSGLEVVSSRDEGAKKIKRAQEMVKRGESNLDEDRTSAPDGNSEKTDEYLEEIRLLEDILLQAQRIANHWGGELIFIYLTGADRFLGTLQGPLLAQEDVLRMVENMRVPVINVEAALKALPDPMEAFPFRRGGHYNTTGYETTANYIADRLKNSLN